MGHMVYVRSNKNKPGEPGRWKEKKKIEAVTTFLATGNTSLTAKMINVPLDTLNKWKASEWWKSLTEKFYEEETLQLDSKLSKTLNKSIEAVNDRLENGDFVYNSKTGKLQRIPAKLRDVHRVTVELIDKQRVLRKQPTHFSERNENVEGRLLKLAEQFAQFVTGKPMPEKLVNEVYEGSFEELPEEYSDAIINGSNGGEKDAIYDQRQEGLSEGESLGPQDGNTSEGQSSEEQGTGNGGEEEGN